MWHKFRNDFVFGMIVNSLENGKKQGFVRDDVNCRILAKLRIEEIDIAFDPNIFPPDKYKMVETQLAMTEHFLYGVCTLKGHKLINKYKQIIEDE
jgi:hypothetical protein